MYRIQPLVEAGLITAGVGVGIGASFIATHLFGGWTPPLTSLVLLSSIDFATGWGASMVEATRDRGPGLSSKRGYRGLIKKVAMFAIVAVGHLIDEALGQGDVLRNGVAYWFLAIELLSITENAGRMGLPIPPMLTAVIAVLKGRGGETPQKEGGA